MSDMRISQLSLLYSFLLMEEDYVPNLYSKETPGERTKSFRKNQDAVRLSPSRAALQESHSGHSPDRWSEPASSARGILNRMAGAEDGIRDALIRCTTLVSGAWQARRERPISSGPV